MRTPVSAWFDDWAREHFAVCRLPKDHDPDDEQSAPFWRTLAKLFGLRGITHEAAQTATEQAALDPPPPKKHLGAVVRLAMEAMKAGGGQVDALPIDDTRETAEAASKDCPHCGGATGLAPVVYRGSGESQRVRSTCAYCVCRLGRWVRRTHERNTPDVFRRIPDLADAIAGRSAWMSPEAPEEACPLTTTSAPW